MRRPSRRGRPLTSGVLGLTKEADVAASKKAQKFISYKVRKLMAEGKTPRQAVGAAYGMARSEGYRVPKKGKK